MVIELNRPSALNALNVEMIDKILLAVQLYGNLSIILKSSSRNFCAGGDVKSLVLDPSLCIDFF